MTPVAMSTTTTLAPMGTATVGVQMYVTNIGITNTTPQGEGQPFQNPPIGATAQLTPMDNILPPQALQHTLIIVTPSFTHHITRSIRDMKLTSQ
jgi:hypothetical protein